MQFVKVKRTHGTRTLNYGWMMKLSSSQVVLEYFNKWDNMANNVYGDMNAIIDNTRHYTGEASYAVAVMAEVRKISPIHALGDLISQRMKEMFRSLPVYVNYKGGWFPRDDKCEEYDRVECDTWPGDMEPEYKQWPGGRHWYCKVGGKDVIVDDIQKWNSLKAAQRAYKEWKKKI